MNHELTITASHGVTFTVVVSCTVWSPHRPTVTFYDARYADDGRFTQWGQKVSDYFIETLLDSDGGIDLHGGVPDWRIDASAMHTVRNWLRSIDPIDIEGTPEFAAARGEEQA